MSFIMKGDKIEFDGSIDDLKKEISQQFAKRKISAQQMAKDNNVCVKTLYNWAYKYGNYRFMGKSYSIIQRVKLLIKYESLKDSEKGNFLRSNGLYDEDLNEWKNQINDLPNTPTTKDHTSEKSMVSLMKAELKMTKKLIAKKNRELKDSDKKLKEANALLDLKKKVDALFENKDEE